MKFKMLSFALSAFSAGSVANASVKTKYVEYRQGDTTLEGFLAYDETHTEKVPGILIVHDWKGLGKYAEDRAKLLASMGYVAFAADIYGKGVRPKTQQEAGEQAGKYKKDVPLLRARAQAGLKVLQENSLVDTSRLVAIGYCFGGTTALELARSGADLKGVVSFHGGLETPDAKDAKHIKAHVLVMTGADDPMVPPAQVNAFEDEMRNAKVDWQLISYGGAVHAFTNPEAGNDNSKGMAYNKLADERSWRAMKDFYSEILKK